MDDEIDLQKVDGTRTERADLPDVVNLSNFPKMTYDWIRDEVIKLGTSESTFSSVESIANYIVKEVGIQRASVLAAIRDITNKLAPEKAPTASMPAITPDEPTLTAEQEAQAIANAALAALKSK